MFAVYNCTLKFMLRVKYCKHKLLQNLVNFRKLFIVIMTSYL